MTLPLISIIIPTYNRAHFIGACIQSVLDQSVLPAEIIVVDDGSTDDTETVVRSVDSERVRYFRKANSGAPDTRNFAAERAEGEFIITIGSDDVMLPGAMESIVDAYQENPECDFYYGDLIVTSAELNPRIHIRYADFENRESDLASALAFTSQICDGFGMLKRSFLLENGGYSSEFAKCHDWEFWARTSEHIRVKRVDAALGYWRWHDSNISVKRNPGSAGSPDRIIQDRGRMVSSPEAHLINLGWEGLENRKLDRPVYVWGAGAYGIAVKLMLEYMGVEPVLFVDSDPSKCGTEFEGLNVVNPESLMSAKSKPFVVVGSVYEHEIAAELEEMGFREKMDYHRVHGVEYHRI